MIYCRRYKKRKLSQTLAVCTLYWTYLVTWNIHIRKRFRILLAFVRLLQFIFIIMFGELTCRSVQTKILLREFALYIILLATINFNVRIISLTTYDFLPTDEHIPCYNENGYEYLLGVLQFRNIQSEAYNKLK